MNDTSLVQASPHSNERIGSPPTPTHESSQSNEQDKRLKDSEEETVTIKKAKKKQKLYV